MLHCAVHDVKRHERYSSKECQAKHWKLVIWHQVGSTKHKRKSVEEPRLIAKVVASTKSTIIPMEKVSRKRDEDDVVSQLCDRRPSAVRAGRSDQIPSLFLDHQPSPFDYTRALTGVGREDTDESRH